MKRTAEEVDATDEKIIKLAKQGLSSTVIAARVGLSRSRVNERISMLRSIRSDLPPIGVMKTRWRNR